MDPADLSAAIGGAIAAGTVAWFLMRSAAPQVEVSEWRVVNSE